jgi:hypothetical protein
MYALVVFESMYGNTEQLAGAVADGLRLNFDVDVLNVDEAPPNPPTGVDLLVVGGPTHVFGLSRKQTRTDAATRTNSDLVSRFANLRDWLSRVPSKRRDRDAAAFGTRTKRASWAPGSAARGAAKLLRRSGYRLVAEPEDFYVEDTLGPVAIGEIERARRWGEDVALRWDKLGSDQPGK